LPNGLGRLGRLALFVIYSASVHYFHVREVLANRQIQLAEFLSVVRTFNVLDT